jgi:signal transduction histidine kinase
VNLFKHWNILKWEHVIGLFLKISSMINKENSGGGLWKYEWKKIE